MEMEMETEMEMEMETEMDMEMDMEMETETEMEMDIEMEMETDKHVLLALFLWRSLTNIESNFHKCSLWCHLAQSRCSEDIYGGREERTILGPWDGALSVLLFGSLWEIHVN